MNDKLATQPDPHEEEDGYDFCPRCEDWVPEDVFFHEMDDGVYVCQSCYENAIDAAHDHLMEAMWNE